MELCTYEKNIISHIKRNKNKRDLFIVNIEHVSQSGMTRYIKIGMVYKGEFVNITPILKKFDGQSFHGNYDGYKIGGCGMDMRFAALQDLAHYLNIKNPVHCTAFQHFNTF